MIFHSWKFELTFPTTCMPANKTSTYENDSPKYYFHQHILPISLESNKNCIRWIFLTVGARVRFSYSDRKVVEFHFAIQNSYVI